MNESRGTSVLRPPESPRAARTPVSGLHALTVTFRRRPAAACGAALSGLYRLSDGEAVPLGRPDQASIGCARCIALVDNMLSVVRRPRRILVRSNIVGLMPFTYRFDDVRRAALVARLDAPGVMR